ncbi:hypothetical protein FACS1894211_16720 [Clostridia bacterium]|nr:hypothetical protein FACS1894211_16720 [Clostridia bacterium]
MKYVYRFDYIRYNGKSKAYIPDTVEIEANSRWYAILKELDRRERNSDRAETRRHIGYEKLELLDDYLIPKELYSDGNDPVNVLTDRDYTQARSGAYYNLYDKILRKSGGILTDKQFQAFQYRALCEVPFEQAAYFMKFDFLPMSDNIPLAKKHYYAAVRKIRKYFTDDYKRLKNFFQNR